MSTTIRRTAITMVATCLLLAGFVTSAAATPRGYQEATHKEGLFYGDVDLGVSLFAGATAQQFCTGDEPTAPARVFTRRDGTVHIRVDNVRYPIYLYSSALGGPELIEATCEAMFDDDPTTVPLEPFAVGEGRVRMRITIRPDGTVHVVNAAVGDATSANGATWRVRGRANLMVVDGVPVGDPAEFQGLMIRRVGR